MNPPLTSPYAFLILGLVSFGCTVAPAAAEPGPQVVVLGVAQDAGHPQAGCTKSCCTPAHADPSASHEVSSLGIIDGEHRILIDATPDLTAQLHALSPSGRLDGILLTHAHIGHYTGLVHLGREAMGSDHIPVYAMPRMKSFLQSDRPWSLLASQGHIDLVAMSDGTPIQVSPRVRVTPFAVPHRDEISETVGFHIQGPKRSLVFIPDIDKWSRWDRPIEGVVAEVDVALLDGTFYGDGEVPRDMSLIPHPFVQESLARFATLPLQERQKILFIHLNHSNPLLDPTSEARGAVGKAGMSVATQGQVIAL